RATTCSTPCKRDRRQFHGVATADRSDLSGRLQVRGRPEKLGNLLDLLLQLEDRTDLAAEGTDQRLADLADDRAQGPAIFGQLDQQVALVGWVAPAAQKTGRLHAPQERRQGDGVEVQALAE